MAVADISTAFINHGLCASELVLLPPGPTCWCSSCTGVIDLDKGALWGNGGLWGALCEIGRVMPCEELSAGATWLRDMTVEGIRLGERLDVLVARRTALCCSALLDVLGIDAAGLALPLAPPSVRGLADVLRGVLL